MAPPPSPSTLSPSQLKLDNEHESKIHTKVNQKDVLVQETIEKFPIHSLRPIEKFDYLISIPFLD